MDKALKDLTAELRRDHEEHCECLGCRAARCIAYQDDCNVHMARLFLRLQKAMGQSGTVGFDKLVEEIERRLGCSS